MKCEKCNGTGKIKHPKDLKHFFRLVDIEADKAYHVTYEMAKEKAYKKVGFDLVECPVCKGTGTVPDTDTSNYTPLEAIPRSPDDPILPGFFDDFGASGVKVVERAPGYEALMKELGETGGTKKEVSYEQAKEIAQKTAFHPINKAQESTTAYIFDNADQTFIGGLPIVIAKADGKAYNYHQYVMAMPQEEYDGIKDK